MALLKIQDSQRFMLRFLPSSTKFIAYYRPLGMCVYECVCMHVHLCDYIAIYAYSGTC